MKKFINNLLISRDNAAIDKIIAEYEAYCNSDGAQRDSVEVQNIFEKMNKYYKKYALGFSKDISNKNYDDAAKKFSPFIMSSMVCSFIFQKMGAYEAQKEILDFYYQSINDNNLIVPPTTTKIFQNMKIENLLRLSIIKKDSGEASDAFQPQLDMVHDHLYANMAKATPESIGDLALYHFASGNETRAFDYLEMQYSKFQNGEKVVSCEITENNGFFKRSATGQRYKAFVETFLDSKTNVKKLKIS